MNRYVTGVDWINSKLRHRSRVKLIPDYRTDETIFSAKSIHGIQPDCLIQFPRLTSHIPYIASKEIWNHHWITYYLYIIYYNI